MDKKQDPLHTRIQRKLVNFFCYIGLVSFGSKLMPKQDKKNLKGFISAVKELRDKTASVYQEIINGHPDIGVWFTEEKIKRIPGGFITFNAAIAVMKDMMTMEQIVYYFRHFVVNDETYIETAKFFIQHPQLMAQYGLFDEKTGETKKMDGLANEAYSLMFIKQLATVLMPVSNTKMTLNQFCLALSVSFDEQYQPPKK